MIVGILQSIGNLFDVADDGRKGQDAAFGVTLPERAASGIVHDQERGVILHIKVKHAYNVGMAEMGNSVGLFLEALHFGVVGKPRIEDFDGGLGAQA